MVKIWTARGVYDSMAVLTVFSVRYSDLRCHFVQLEQHLRLCLRFLRGGKGRDTGDAQG